MSQRSPAREATRVTVMLSAIGVVTFLILSGLVWLGNHTPAWFGIAFMIVVCIAFIWVVIYLTERVGQRGHL